MVSEYIRATVQVGKDLYRVYCHHDGKINCLELSQFLECESRPIIDNVSAVDEFDIDDPLEIIMIDENEIFFW